MINYISKKSDNKLYISKGNEYIVKDMPITRFLNELLRPGFSTLCAREKTTKKIFGFKSKIPILIDADNLLMPIRSYRSDESLLINYYSIYRIQENTNDYVLTFHNGHAMKINEKYSFDEQYSRCERIAKFVNEQENVFI